LKGLKKISTRIFLGIFTSSVIVFGISTLTDYFYTRNILSGLVRKLVERTFYSAHNQINAELRPIIDNIENTTFFLANFNFSDPEVQIIKENTFNRFEGIFECSLVTFRHFDTSCQIHYFTADTFCTYTSNVEQVSDYLKLTQQLPQAELSPVEISLHSDTISFSSYAYGQSKNVRIRYNFHLERFIQLLNTQTQLDNNRYYLFDKERHVIKNEIGLYNSVNNTVIEEEIKRLLVLLDHERRGLVIPKNLSSGRAFFIEKLYGTDLVLASSMGINEVLKQFRNFSQITFFISLLAILILAYILQDLIIRLTKPITELTNISRKIQNGSLNTVVPEFKGDGESAQLSMALRTVQGRMKRYVHDLNSTLKEKRELEHELKIANKIQSDMLPVPDRALMELPEIDLYARMTPAMGIAGDFYDYFFLDKTNLFFVIGDVSGKGIPAALFMVKAITLIELEARRFPTPSKVFKTVNDQLCRKNDEGMFVTAICGLINIDTGELKLCDAGHNTPIMSLNNEEFNYNKINKGMPLGIMKGKDYFDTNISLRKADTLVFYTDGFSECVGKSNAMLGEAALLNSLKGKNKSDLMAIAKTLWNLIKNFRQATPASDDSTLLILRYAGK
jgi:serine phosphatase RsbU (regulator of sigma subunit)